jgi:hypothetical protein
MWNELEKLVQAYANTSNNHKRILDCLLDCRKAEDSSTVEIKQEPIKEEKPVVTEKKDVPWKEYDRLVLCYDFI